MASPRISVLVPTRNRPAEAVRTIRSILRQDVDAPFEVVVAENSNDGGAAEDLRREFAGDARVRLHRTGGLAQDENWEAALSAAEGEYVTVVPDKCVLRRSALSTALRGCEAHGCSIAAWAITSYYPTSAPHRVTAAPPWGPPRVMTTREVAASFVREPAWEGVYLPVPHSALFQRSLAERARQGPGGALFLPVAADCTAAFQLLALSDRILMIDSALTVYERRPGGVLASLLRGDAQGQAIEARVPSSQLRPYEELPFPHRTAVNLTLRDYERIQHLYPERLPAFEPWLPGYLGAMIRDTMRVEVGATTRAEHVRQVRETLARLSAGDLSAVEAYCRTRWGLRLDVLDPPSAPQGEPVPFVSPLDLLEWEDRRADYLVGLECRRWELRQACAEKEQVIQELAAACAARDQEIKSLAAAAQERLALIEQLHASLAPAPPAAALPSVPIQSVQGGVLSTVWRWARGTRAAG